MRFVVWQSAKHAPTRESKEIPNDASLRHASFSRLHLDDSR